MLSASVESAFLRGSLSLYRLIFLLRTLSIILQILGLDLTLIFKHLEDHRQDASPSKQVYAMQPKHRVAKNIIYSWLYLSEQSDPQSLQTLWAPVGLKSEMLKGSVCSRQSGHGWFEIVSS